MIIQIRGTSGSGKSYCMRKVMEGYEWTPYYIKGTRKKPIYYHASITGKRVCVLGHYESPCGGGDTIGSAKQIAAEIQYFEVSSRFDIILVEGLLLSEDVKWTKEMKDVQVFFLTTPVETCIEQIKNRREEVGNEKPLNEHNTRNRVGVIERARKRLIEEGVSCKRGPLPLIVKMVRKLLEN